MSDTNLDVDSRIECAWTIASRFYTDLAILEQKNARSSTARGRWLDASTGSPVASGHARGGSHARGGAPDAGRSGPAAERAGSAGRERGLLSRLCSHKKSDRLLHADVRRPRGSDLSTF